jgi:hypothetical protein
MSDRELTELAAKAAGIELACYDEESGQWFRVTDDPEKVRQAHGYASAVFDPLDDDGDALRLAVKLRLHVIFTPDRYVNAQSQAGVLRAEKMGWNLDDFAATRRAIVTAAAEIGRSQ